MIVLYWLSADSEMTDAYAVFGGCTSIVWYSAQQSCAYAVTVGIIALLLIGVNVWAQSSHMIRKKSAIKRPLLVKNLLSLLCGRNRHLHSCFHHR